MLRKTGSKTSGSTLVDAMDEMDDRRVAASDMNDIQKRNARQNEVGLRLRTQRAAAVFMAHFDFPTNARPQQANELIYSGGRAHVQ